MITSPMAPTSPSSPSAVSSWTWRTSISSPPRPWRTFPNITTSSTATLPSRSSWETATPRLSSSPSVPMTNSCKRKEKIKGKMNKKKWDSLHKSTHKTNTHTHILQNSGDPFFIVYTWDIISIGWIRHNANYLLFCGKGFAMNNDNTGTSFVLNLTMRFPHTQQNVACIG